MLYPIFNRGSILLRTVSWFSVLTILLSPLVYGGGESFYPERPEDPMAVYFSESSVETQADGSRDAGAALQAAIDRLEQERNFGIVLVGPGEYRLSGPVYIWKGIRVIGYGAERPRFILPADTGYYREGEGKYLFHFASDKPAEGDPIRDANPGTFYSALSNVDIVIESGNPAAVGVRSHFAQHCFLAHIDFWIGEGRAGVEKVGNLIEDCRFFGGDYGIMTKKPSPSWPFVLLDSKFDGQRLAAILTEEAGMTIIRAQISNTVSAVVISPDRAEELYVEDSRFESISGPAIVVSDEYNSRPQYNLTNVTCSEVPELVRFRLSGKSIAGGGEKYVVNSFTHGLQIADLGEEPKVETVVDMEAVDQLPELVESDIPALPAMSNWVDVTSLGLVGDGETDNTEAFRKAVSQHESLYFPIGRYRIADTISLGEKTALIGLSPITTQIVIAEDTPAFTGAGPAKALIESSRGGKNIMVGLGIDTALAPPESAYSREGLVERRWWKRQSKNGPIPNRAVALKWMAGSDSLVSDVRFLGGHGTYYSDGTSVPHYDVDRSGDGDPQRRWDSQYTSLWVTENGGGTFVNLWTPNSYAQSGMLIEDTRTSGRVYQISSEHHMRNELVVRRAANWRFYAFQIEEEAAEGKRALPVRIENSDNILFANLYLYRVMRTATPYPRAVLLQNSRDLVFKGVHVYGPSKYNFDDTIYDQSSGMRVRTREIAKLSISGSKRGTEPDSGLVLSLSTGFNNIDSIETDSAGNVYFVDSLMQSIYRWRDASGELSLVCDEPIEPVGLIAYGEGKLLVVNRVGQVYTLTIDENGSTIEELVALEGPPSGSEVIGLPLTLWRDEHTFLKACAEVKPFHYRSPDGKVSLPADQRFVDALSGSSHFSTIDLVRARDLSTAEVGERVFVADEFGQKTYSFTMRADGSLADPRLFAEAGEGGVTVDESGNVYLCAGDVLVYDPAGKMIDRIGLPERPSSLAFGGADGKTLFVTARGSLYAVRIPGY